MPFIFILLLGPRPIHVLSNMGHAMLGLGGLAHFSSLPMERGFHTKDLYKEGFHIDISVYR